MPRPRLTSIATVCACSLSSSARFLMWSRTDAVAVGIWRLAEGDVSTAAVRTCAFVTKTGAGGKQEPWLSYGIVGGYQQPQAHVQVVLNIIVFGMDVQQALDAGRFHHYSGRRVSLEHSIPEAVFYELKQMGHTTRAPRKDFPAGFEFGGGQAIMRNEQGYVGGSDSRRDGEAAAY